MTDQLLPTVKPEILESILADFEGNKLGVWLARLAAENPQIVVAIDALGGTGNLVAASLVYALLNSQAEANQMNEDFQ